MQTKQVCQLDAAGYFVGLATAYESPRDPGVFPLPGGCIDVQAPETPEGHRARWVAGAWQFEPAGTDPDTDPLPQDPADQIRHQINSIEKQTLMNRAMREGLLLLFEREAMREFNVDQPTAAAGLYSGNLAYKRVKDIDNQIIDLRLDLEQLGGQ